MHAHNRYITSLTSMLVMFFIIEGVWGLFSNVVFGILTTNTLHASIHIVLALVGFYCMVKSTSKLYCLCVGLLILTIGILRFIPATGSLVVEQLNVNAPVAYLNLLLGIIYTLLGLDRSGEEVTE